MPRSKVNLFLQDKDPSKEFINILSHDAFPELMKQISVRNPGSFIKDEHLTLLGSTHTLLGELTHWIFENLRLRKEPENGDTLYGGPYEEVQRAEFNTLILLAEIAIIDRFQKGVLVSAEEFYYSRKAFQKLIDSSIYPNNRPKFQANVIGLEKFFWFHQSYWSGFVCWVQMLWYTLKDWWNPETSVQNPLGAEDSSNFSQTPRSAKLEKSNANWKTRSMKP